MSAWKPAEYRKPQPYPTSGRMAQFLRARVGWGVRVGELVRLAPDALRSPRA